MNDNDAICQHENEIKLNVIARTLSIINLCAKRENSGGNNDDAVLLSVRVGMAKVLITQARILCKL